MARFKGFSTIDKFKKFTLTDSELVKRDLLNALSIREGELPGRPEFGTRIWNFVFEALTPELNRQISAELQRLIDYDPRLVLNDVIVSTDENTVLLELVVTINPNSSPQNLKIKFDEESQSVAIV